MRRIRFASTFDLSTDVVPTSNIFLLCLPNKKNDILNGPDLFSNFY